MFVQYNFDEVVPGQVYRSSQPDPDHLRSWIQAYHIRTVINLRGDSNPDVASEVEVLRRSGVNYVSLRLNARRLPTRDELRRLMQIIEQAERPVLIHCRAGADRTSLASFIAAMAVAGESFETARRQISIRYWHVGDWGDDVADPANAYKNWCRSQHLPTAGWAQFREWATNVYNPD